MLISIAKSALIKPAGILLLVLNLGLFLVSFSGLLTAVDERSLYPLALINEHLQEQGRKGGNNDNDNYTQKNSVFAW